MKFTNKLINKTHVQPNQTKASDNKSLSVLLLEEHPSSKSILKNALMDFDYNVTKSISLNDSIIDHIELCQPDILILSTEILSDVILKELAVINKILPLPIIIFAENDSPNVIQHSIKAGVSAYVAHEISPQRIHSIISVANERFKEVQTLRNELKLAKMQLESRKLIERAKGHLMQLKKMSEKEAYGTLRKMAMDQSSPISMVAKNIIDVYELLATPNL
ncbi:MAG: response regulator NasT [Alteromonadaceae bacterium]|jgi:response regulator NasT